MSATTSDATAASPEWPAIRLSVQPIATASGIRAVA